MKRYTLQVCSPHKIWRPEQLSHVLWSMEQQDVEMQTRSAALTEQQLEDIVVPATFSGDVINAVCDYCADGIDAFESCLAQAPALEPHVLEDIRKGLQGLYSDLTRSSLSGLALFEQLCSTTFFHVPAHALLRPALEGLTPPALPSSSTSEAEEELDRQLEVLRSELRQVCGECEGLRAEAHALDREVAAYGDTASFQALAATATGNGAGGSSSGSEGSVASDVAAIASAAQGLAALLEQAAALRTAGGGAAGLKAGNASTGWPGGSDWRMSQQAKIIGPLSSLQQLNALLQVA